MRTALAYALLWLAQAVAPVAAQNELPPGCRLAADDPLRGQVDRVMREGAEFEAEQRALLQHKVARLGAVKGWSAAEQDAYFRRAVLVGNGESWARTLEVAAAFIAVCQEQIEGHSRADAVRLFAELYAVERQQWRRIVDGVERDLSAATQGPPP